MSAVPPEKVLADVARRLSEPLSKDPLLKLLKQAGNVLSDLKQSSSLQRAIALLSDSLVQKKLLQHKDKDVRILLAVCFCEIIRILAPSPPFKDQILKGIFKLIIDMFSELSDVENVYFGTRVKVLETVAALKCCVLMLDIGCESLVLEMFNIFFSVISDKHQLNVLHAMLSMMTDILEEKVSKSIFDVIIRNILKEGKGGSHKSLKLATSLVQNCATSLEPHVRGFLNSCISERESSGNELKEFYHEIIYQIYQCAPQMLIAVLPNLTKELLTDQVDVRIKAVHLIGKLLKHSRLQLAVDYRPLFVEFLKRFSDKSSEVRSCAVDCAKACYLVKPSGPEASEFLSALEGRLLDFDDKIRIQAVSVFCDLAKVKLETFPPELVLQVAERVRDKKVSVRKKAAVKLVELYCTYCVKSSEGLLPLTDHFEQIPSKLLTLCFDKDSKEFSVQKMELMLAGDLFPPSLSAKERVCHWMALFAFFSSPQRKIFNSILAQKQRFQQEIKTYLALRERGKAKTSEEVREKISACLQKMALSFSDPVKAKEGFGKLHQMKDNNIFKALHGLSCEQDSSKLQQIQEAFLKRIGDKHPNYDFFKVLSLKCAHSIFSADHVYSMIEDLLTRKDSRDQYLDTSTFDLLFSIVSTFPSLLRGSEQKFLRLFPSDVDHLSEKLLQMLTSASSHISIKLSDVYPFLELACLEGTRAQSKQAVSTMALFASAPDKLIFDELCEKLLRLLYGGRNVPTVLQSLGCMALYFFSSFQLYAEEITQHIVQQIVFSADVRSAKREGILQGGNTCSASCQLKIYGLKALVRSCLPLQVSHSQNQIRGLLIVLSKILLHEDGILGVVSSEADAAHLRLAAAKSVVRLSTRWDLHIPPLLFNSAMALAKDPYPLVSHSFLRKINKFLGDQAIPKRYACAFALGCCPESPENTESDAWKFLIEFFREYNRRAAFSGGSTLLEMEGTVLTSLPAYIVVFLVHLLAHDPGFPAVDSQDESGFATLCSPLVAFLRASIDPDVYYGSNIDVNEISPYLCGIFSAIRKAADGVDLRFSPKVHWLAEIGLLMVKKYMEHTQRPMSLSSRLILLPSSLYKVGDGAGGLKGGPHLEASLMERLLRMALPTRTDDMRREKETGTGKRKKMALEPSRAKREKDEEYSGGGNIPSSCSSVITGSAVDPLNL
ncbi:ARM repeat superfamily protein [Wolffia australiana]